MAVFSMLVVITTASCQKKASDTPRPGVQRLTVVASLFPVYDFARQVAGDRANISLLLPPGTEPHSFDPRPGDIVRLGNADIFLYTSAYMEPWAGRILQGIDNKKLLAVETGRGLAMDEESTADHGKTGDTVRHDHGAMDPHIWLDFSNASRMVSTVRNAFISKDPANRDFYTANAAAYIKQLSALDDQYRTSLQGCRKKIFVNGGHFTFGYLAKRYGLSYISAYGLSPNSEPTPESLVRVATTLRKNGLRHIFFEELITPRIAETIGRETGAELIMLHGAHNISKDEFGLGVTFMSLMESNLMNLMIGLQC